MMVFSAFSVSSVRKKIKVLSEGGIDFRGDMKYKAFSSNDEPPMDSGFNYWRILCLRLQKF